MKIISGQFLTEWKAFSLHTVRSSSAPVMSVNHQILSSIQILLALVLAILVLTTPFAGFKFYGYGAFGIYANENTSTALLAFCITLTTLAIAYAGYMWGWKSSGQTAAKYAKITLSLAALEWVWVIFGYLVVSNDIVYHASYAFHGYSAWVDVASYGVVLGAILFTIIGVLANRMTRAAQFPLETQATIESPTVKAEQAKTRPSIPRGQAKKVEAEVTKAETAQIEKQFCMNCGAELRPKSKFCNKCGSAQS